MEHRQAKIGQSVELEDGTQATIVEIASGWCTIRMSDGSTRKARAKALTEAKAIVEETREDMTEDTRSDEAAGGQEDTKEEITWGCGNCDSTFKSTRTENVRCPNCGRWMEIKLKFDKSRYVTGKASTASGRDSVDIADETADRLRGLRIEEAYEAVAETMTALYIPRDWFSPGMAKSYSATIPHETEATDKDLVEAFLRAKYEHLNLGMQRMNLGNLLRGCAKRKTANDAAEIKAAADIREWAKANYEKGGDVIEETYSDAELLELIREAGTPAKAMREAKAIAKIWKEKQEDCSYE